MARKIAGFGECVCTGARLKLDASRASARNMCMSCSVKHAWFWFLLSAATMAKWQQKTSHQLSRVLRASPIELTPQIVFIRCIGIV